MSRPVSSRRNFLTAAVAGTVAASGTLGAHVALASVTESITAAAVSPDLAKLIDTYQEADRAYQLAEDRTEAPFKRYMAMGGHTNLPDAFYSQAGDHRLGIHASRHSGGRLWCSDLMLDQLRTTPRMTTTTRETSDKVALPGEQYVGYSEQPDGSKSHRYQTAVPWPEAQARADEILAAYDWREAEEERRGKASGYAPAREEAGRLAAVSDRALHAVMRAEARSMADVIAKLNVYASVHDADAILIDVDLDDLENASVRHVLADLYCVTKGLRS